MESSTSEVDTADPIVLPSDAAPVAHDAYLRRHRWLWWAVPVGVLGALLVGSLFVNLPYYAISPGTAPAVSTRLSVPKDLNYPPQGQVLLTTVSLQRVRPLEALRGWLDDDIDVVPEERILGPTPRKDFRQQNAQEMDDSILVAEVVALRKLGYTVAEHGAGALVTAVNEGAPAEGHLKAGDVITGVNGKPVQLAGQLISALSTRRFGDTIKLTVTTGAQPARTETIQLGGANANKSQCSRTDQLTGRGCLGIALGTKSHEFDRPVKVDINAGGIGGPSAGLAFTLAIMDQLRPGELTGGRKVAVTGTIDIDGNVGDVGGVVQKTAAVRRSGATVFLVPPGEYNDAKAHAGSKLEVIKVATLDEALQALGRLGGDLASIAPTTTTTVRRARR
jgi:PDZ domain-containing protein